VVTLDVPTAISFKAKDFERNKSDVQAILRKAAVKKGDVTKANLESAYLNMEKKRRKLFGEIHEDTQAAMRLGMTKRNVLFTLMGAGLGKKEAARVVENIYVPYIPSSRFLQSIAISAAAKDDESKTLIQSEVNRRRSLINKIAQENIDKN
jgi:hypothetical protein